MSRKPTAVYVTIDFQSHYGLILSKQRELTMSQILTFNPTMVWFYQFTEEDAKEIYEALSIPLWSDFILRPNQTGTWLVSCFQSHYGLILSKYAGINTFHILCSFQSHYGLILSGSQPVIQKERLHFQSHYGLILSVELGNRKKRRIALSIPLWSDFISTAYFYVSLRSNRFQSHYGLILSYVVRRNDERVKELSIPLWSDFIKVDHPPFDIHIIFFQSHYGLILSARWSSTSWKAGTTFNPTMVWFYQLQV